MFCPLSREEIDITQKITLNTTSSDSQIYKPQRGRPKRAELPDVNINKGAQSIILRAKTRKLRRECDNFFSIPCYDNNYVQL